MDPRRAQRNLNLINHEIGDIDLPLQDAHEGNFGQKSSKVGNTKSLGVTPAIETQVPDAQFSISTNESSYNSSHPSENFSNTPFATHPREESKPKSRSQPNPIHPPLLDDNDNNNDDNSKIFISTQIQGRLESYEQESALKSSLQRFKYMLDKNPSTNKTRPQEISGKKRARRAAAAAARKRAVKRAKTITEYSIADYKQTRTQHLLEQLSGKHEKVKDIIQAQMKTLERRVSSAPSSMQNGTDSNKCYDVYNAEEWRKIRSLLIKKFPQSSPMEVKEVRRYLYGERADSDSLWESSQLPSAEGAELLTQGSQVSVGACTDDNKETARKPVMMSLSQVMEDHSIIMDEQNGEAVVNYPREDRADDVEIGRAKLAESEDPTVNFRTEVETMFAPDTLETQTYSDDDDNGNNGKGYSNGHNGADILDLQVVCLLGDENETGEVAGNPVVIDSHDEEDDDNKNEVSYHIDNGTKAKINTDDNHNCKSSANEIIDLEAIKQEDDDDYKILGKREASNQRGSLDKAGNLSSIPIRNADLNDIIDLSQGSFNVVNSLVSPIKTETSNLTPSGRLLSNGKGFMSNGSLSPKNVTAKLLEEVEEKKENCNGGGDSNNYNESIDSVFPDTRTTAHPSVEICVPRSSLERAVVEGNQTGCYSNGSGDETLIYAVKPVVGGSDNEEVIPDSECDETAVGEYTKLKIVKVESRSTTKIKPHSKSSPVRSFNDFELSELRKTMKILGLKPARSKSDMLASLESASQVLSQDTITSDSRLEIYGYISSLVEESPELLEKIYTLQPILMNDLVAILSKRDPFMDCIDEPTIRDWADRQGVTIQGSWDRERKTTAN